MYRLQCGFRKISRLEEYFRGANTKKGKLLVKNVYDVEQVIDGAAFTVKARCVLQVSDHVVYNVELEASALYYHLWCRLKSETAIYTVTVLCCCFGVRK